MGKPVIAIVGAGPAGLACALGLAAFDVPCVLLDDGYEISDGSRATGLSRRALQILTPSGVADEVMGVAIVQVANQAFAGETELFLDRAPPESGKYPRVVNIPQDRLEHILLKAVAERPAIELRRGHRVTAVRAGDDSVDVEAQVGADTVAVHADWLVVCDGGHSSIRRAMGLVLEGVRHDARFIVTDVRARIDVPEGVRRIWFDPPSNPGGTIIMHQQPEDVWRLDFGVPAGESVEGGLARESIEARVAAHLELLGVDGPWELLWMGDYTATSVGLERYRHGRVLFAGDSAHLIPIFGGRGMNSAIEDGFNVAWKLAAVAHGGTIDGRGEQIGGAEWLLDTYSQERVAGAHQNMAKAGIGAEVIAARSPGSLLLRRAALELILEQRPVASLLDHRISDANSYACSPLRAGEPEGEGPVAGRPGEALLDVQARLGDGSRGYLIDALRDGFMLIDVTVDANGSSPCTVPGELPETLLGLPLNHLRVHAPPGDEASVYDPGVYLVRPDRYVMARGGPGCGVELVADAEELLQVPVSR
jgi:3-(3-hydroxy-phenyl)propionate hydroxylase